MGVELGMDPWGWGCGGSTDRGDAVRVGNSGSIFQLFLSIISTGSVDIAQCDSTQGLLAGTGCEVVGGANGTQDLLYMDCIEAGNSQRELHKIM